MRDLLKPEGHMTSVGSEYAGVLQAPAGFWGRFRHCGSFCLSTKPALARCSHSLSLSLFLPLSLSLCLSLSLSLHALSVYVIHSSMPILSLTLYPSIYLSLCLSLSLSTSSKSETRGLVQVPSPSFCAHLQTDLAYSKHIRAFVSGIMPNEA